MAGAAVGKCFNSYESLKSFVKDYEKEKFVQLSVQSSSKIETQKSKSVSLIHSKLANANKDLVYSTIKYRCIHGSNFKSQGNGQRKTQTFKQGCPFSLKISLSADAQKLRISDLVETHNHGMSEEVFKSLPRQRLLDANEKEAVQEMLALRCNKKLIKQHIVESMGKNVILKDVHNMNKVQEGNDLQKVVDYLESLGGYVEILANEGKLEGIFFQDCTMKDAFALNPSVVLLDATYCLNNLYMPLYILMVVNGNGQGQVAGIFLLAHETKINISHMLNIFRNMNPKSQDIKVIFTDKDFTERDALRIVFPNASLLLCFFHTLKTFKTKVTCAKMGLSGEVRKEALHILQQIAYSRDEIEYGKNRTLLLNLNINQLTEYYESNWHPIRYEWVRGFIKLETTFNITTTNHLESLNQKIKQVVVRNSNLLTFFKDLMVILKTINHEQKQRAINLAIKKSTQFEKGTLEDFYESKLTPYAWKQVAVEIEAASKLEFCFEASASVDCCGCSFFKNTSLPCRHIFFKRGDAGLELAADTIIPQKYTREYHYDSYTKNSLPSTSVPSPTQIRSLPPPESTRALSKQEKYKKAVAVGNEIANILADYGTENFQCALDALKQFKANLLENNHCSTMIGQQAEGTVCREDDITLKDISLEGMGLKRKGRPKGADTTVVGLKRRKL
uniref:Zinc finger SWIM domain-containing protein 3 n=1 Tax=Cacopsylla melanoneura TaxID=428564 RepID=A0A8D8QF81_9HEMI